MTRRLKPGRPSGARPGVPGATRAPATLAASVLFAAVLVATALLAGATLVLAGLSGSAAAEHTLASATLAPASGLSAATSCGPLLSFSAKVDLSWTATPSAFASGHKVERWLGATLQSTGTVTPRTTTTRTETGLATGTTYTWKVYAYFSGWTSTLVSVSATTPGVCL